MCVSERVERELWNNIAELGQNFTFNVKALGTAKFTNKGGVTKKVWMIVVESPELAQLRESYGLPATVKGLELHITIGYQVPTPEKLPSDTENSFGCIKTIPKRTKRI